ncbi:ADP-ribosyl glycohydrolase [Cladorrhinum sp. PSN259]|nr:ADP-ribosyl glycohydrolase [Cladorrhinum sp. PSN259]
MAPTKQDRVLGGLLGVHAGDSLGATLEFKTWTAVKSKHPTGLREIIGGGNFNWPAGAATDDTDLTRAVLLAYRDRAKLQREGADETDPNKGKDLVMTAANYMLDWYNKGPMDVGMATGAALSNLKRSRNPTTSGMGEKNAGNGTLMRCIPTGLFVEDQKQIEEESINISNITHRDSECALSCAVYNTMVSHLIRGQTAEEAYNAGMGVVKRWQGAEPKGGFRYKAALSVERVLEAGKELVNLDDFATNGPSKAANWRTVMPENARGYVLDSLLLAVAALFDTRSLEHVLVDVVRVGQDTDTNGAIAGGILGARDGVGAIPLRWREKLQFRSEFEDIVDYMLQSAGTGAGDSTSG